MVKIDDKSSIISRKTSCTMEEQNMVKEYEKKKGKGDMCKAVECKAGRGLCRADKTSWFIKTIYESQIDIKILPGS